ncbi:MAG: hypothetical protein GC155_15735 [Alphaproteobacteria bacterium]|nr:hypothetical protein [Alphaproteobacteria bacterium]
MRTSTRLIASGALGSASGIAAACAALAIAALPAHAQSAQEAFRSFEQQHQTSGPATVQAEAERGIDLEARSVGAAVTQAGASAN